MPKVKEKSIKGLSLRNFSENRGKRQREINARKGKRHRERKHPESSYWINMLPRKKELRKQREVNNKKRDFPRAKILGSSS